MTDYYHPKHPQTRRLYKNSRRGKISGVFAGFADYLGVSPTLFRVIGILAILFTGPVVVVAYLLTALLLNEKPHRY